MEPTSVYYEGLLHNLRRRYATFTTPKLQLCIIDPAAVKENRRQHSLRTQKTDQAELIAAIKNGSVVSWRHINLHGEYDFSDEKLQDSVGLDLTKIVGLKLG
jgi:hypothetical protein